jgi:hypothetical protein
MILYIVGQAPRLPNSFVLIWQATRLPYNFRMNPYAKPNERKVGAQRPKISHIPREIDKRTRRQRQAEKQAVAAERRAIKKSARRHLKTELAKELEEDCGRRSEIRSQRTEISNLR